jgi:hypothetical protein
MIDVSNVFLPHPNPHATCFKSGNPPNAVAPLGKGRGLDFPVSPLYKGGLRGVIIRLRSQQTTFQTTSKGRRATGEKIVFSSEMG